jgi:hypothetical protein
MSPEIIQIVVPLTFLAICGLVGEILVQCRRDKTAVERLQLHASPKEGPRSARKARKTMAETRS